jgi:hypothetical protein
MRRFAARVDGWKAVSASLERSNLDLVAKSRPAKSLANVYMAEFAKMKDMSPGLANQSCSQIDSPLLLSTINRRRR